MDNSARVERRIRLAGTLMISGLTAQAVTLFWNHPLSFLAFMFIGSPLVMVGVILYLYSIAAK